MRKPMITKFSQIFYNIFVTNKIQLLVYFRDLLVQTILEKTGKFSGKLRLQKTKFLAGENKKQTIYKENNCLFKLNTDETYFSPRLSNERKLAAEEVLNQIKKSKMKNPKIIVMFAGIAPYPIIIANHPHRY